MHVTHKCHGVKRYIHSFKQAWSGGESAGDAREWSIKSEFIHLVHYLQLQFAVKSMHIRRRKPTHTRMQTSVVKSSSACTLAEWIITEKYMCWSLLPLLSVYVWEVFSCSRNVTVSWEYKHAHMLLLTHTLSTRFSHALARKCVCGDAVVCNVYATFRTDVFPLAAVMLVDRRFLFFIRGS